MAQLGQIFISRINACHMSLRSVLPVPSYISQRRIHINVTGSRKPAALPTLRRNFFSRVVSASAGGGDGGNAGKGPSPPKKPDEKTRLQAELSVLLSLIVSYPAVRGTIAVLAGFYAHIEPLGTLHVDTHDALIGLAFAIPTMCMDALVMGPDWKPESTTKKMRLMLPRPVAERLMQVDTTATIVGTQSSPSSSSRSSSSENGTTTTTTTGVDTVNTVNGADFAQPASSTSTATATATTEAPDEIIDGNNGPVVTMIDEGRIIVMSSYPKDEEQTSSKLKSSSTEGAADGEATTTTTTTAAPPEEIVEVERDVTVRAEQHPFRAAMYRMQTDRTLSNPGRILSIPSEGLLLTLVHVSEEMLYRGFLLTLSARWLTDRLYESGIDESVFLPNGTELAVPQLGAVLAASGMTIVAVGLLVQKELFPLKLLDKAQVKLDGQMNQRENGKKQGNNGSSNISSSNTTTSVTGVAKDLLAKLQNASATAAAASSSSSTTTTTGKTSGSPPANSEAAKKASAEAAKMAEIIAQARSAVEDIQKWSAGVKAVDEFFQWTTLSTSFLLTGNIFAPIVGSIVADVVYSGWQRVRGKQLQAQMKERADQGAEKMKQQKQLLEAVREHRKATTTSDDETTTTTITNAEQGKKKEEEENAEDTSS